MIFIPFFINSGNNGNYDDTKLLKLTLSIIYIMIPYLILLLVDDIEYIRKFNAIFNHGYMVIVPLIHGYIATVLANITIKLFK